MILFIYYLSLQHVKRAALRDFGASSAEVLCEVGNSQFDIMVAIDF